MPFLMPALGGWKFISWFLVLTECGSNVDFRSWAYNFLEVYKCNHIMAESDVVHPLILCSTYQPSHQHFLGLVLGWEYEVKVSGGKRATAAWCQEKQYDWNSASTQYLSLYSKQPTLKQSMKEDWREDLISIPSPNICVKLSKSIISSRSRLSSVKRSASMWMICAFLSSFNISVVLSIPEWRTLSFKHPSPLSPPCTYFILSEAHAFSFDSPLLWNAFSFLVKFQTNF